MFYGKLAIGRNTGPRRSAVVSTRFMQHAVAEIKAQVSWWTKDNIANSRLEFTGCGIRTSFKQTFFR